jgi:hypothetical protein
MPDKEGDLLLFRKPLDHAAMRGRSLSEGTNMPEGLTYQAKKMVVKTALLAVGVTFELAAKHCPDTRREIAGWSDNLVFSMGVLPDGPYISVKKEGEGVRYLGAFMDNPDVAILFKNVDCAVMMFTGQIGTPVAASERRFLIRGNISESMRIARTLNWVQAYLFPSLITDHIFRRPVRLNARQLWIKSKIYAALTPGLLLKAWK